MDFLFRYNTIQVELMNDLVIDKRIFLQIRKRNIGRSLLPEIKYPITFTSNVSQSQHNQFIRRQNEELQIGKQMPFRIKQVNNQPPLSSILISKRIAPSNPQSSPGKQNPKKQNLTSIRKESSIKVMELQVKQLEDFQSRAASSSLSRKVHWKLQEKQAIKLKNNSEITDNTSATKNEKIVSLAKAEQFTVVIGRGNNNEELVRSILLDRKIWKQVQWGECTPHLKWVFSKEKHNYKKMWSYTQTRAINHFQFNQEICTKDNLIRNMQIYCQTKKLELFSLTPVTFIIDFDDEYCEYNLKQFLGFFMKNDPRKQNSSPKRTGALSYNFVNKFNAYMSWQNSDIKKKVNILSRPVNSSTYYSNNMDNPSYIWLLKPTGLNRGRGIQIFDSLQQLEVILMDYLMLFNRRNYKQNSNGQSKKEVKEKDKIRSSNEEMTSKEKEANIEKELIDQQEEQNNKACKQKFRLKTCSFVIQKYVERPLLINSRKFDIRVWALLTQNLNIYFFKEGYIRTSAETFSTDDINNYYIHLTNNAIQKNSSNYGTFENGNQLSYKDIAKSIGEEECENIWERMKEITYMSFSSVKKKLNQYNRKFCFELFGLDYIIDVENKVWLIEINENPCLQCSSPLLGELIPRMISDAFKLTVDQIFQKKPNQKTYKVTGYPDNENLWQSLGQLAPNADYSPTKIPSKNISSSMQ